MSDGTAAELERLMGLVQLLMIDYGAMGSCAVTLRCLLPDDERDNIEAVQDAAQEKATETEAKLRAALAELLAHRDKWERHAEFKNEMAMNAGRAADKAEAERNEARRLAERLHSGAMGVAASEQLGEQITAEHFDFLPETLPWDAPPPGAERTT